MIWHILKYLLSFTISAFYRKIKVKNIHYVKTKNPAVIACNHPNAFMDPILFSYVTFPPKIRYLARGDAFKPGLITTLLQSIGIVPIFRMQDAGIEGLKKNAATYRVVNKLLKRNHKIIIFAEGICIQERRLRAIKKGIPRLIFGAQKELPDKELQVIPACINYSCASKQGSSAFINIGEPFVIKGKIPDFEQNPNKVMLDFMEELHKKMLPLTIHIANSENDHLFESLSIMFTESLCVEKHINSSDLGNRFQAQKEIEQVINFSDTNLKSELQHLNNITKLYDDALTKNKITDNCIQQYGNKNIHKLQLVVPSILLSLMSCIYLPLKFFFFIPFWCSEFLTHKVTKEIEFYASFFLGFSTFIFLFYYLIVFFILNIFINQWVIYMFFACTLACVPFMYFYRKYRQETLSLLKIFKNKTFALYLSKEREKIFKLYEYLSQKYKETIH